MHAPSARLVVPANQTASAWRLRATTVEGLSREVTAGGLNLEISDLNQFAIFLVTSNPDDARQLQQRINRHAERAASLQLQIAQQKYNRTIDTCQKLGELGVSVPVSASTFASVERLLNQAESSLKQRNLFVAESLSLAASRALREIQSRCWRDAINGLSGPTACPHTTGFSSLPDHWELITQCDQQPDSENLLDSGTFENLRLIEDGGWIAPRTAHRLCLSGECRCQNRQSSTREHS